MDRLDYLHHIDTDDNIAYTSFCFISPQTTSNAYSSPSLPDSDSIRAPTPPLTSPGSYPSPPLTGSVLAHTVSLPQVPDDKVSSSQEDSSCCPLDMRQQQPLPHIPISPPPTLPITPLALPLDSGDDGLFLPSPASSSETSPEMVQDPLPPQTSAGSESLALQLPTPWTPGNWLIVGPPPLTMSTEQDILPWEEHRRTPQPLCAEPTHSVWSPESPPRKDELEMETEPLSSSSSCSSSWSLELSSDNDSTWNESWTNQLPLDWAHSRGSNHSEDYYMQSDCLAPILSSFDMPSCSQYRPAKSETLPHFHDYPMDPVDDDSLSLIEDEQELLRSPVWSLRRCASLPGCDEEDPDDRPLLPQTPSRRTLLRDLGPGSDPPPRSAGILTLPGAEHDELPNLDLISPIPGPDVDLFPADITFHGLGLSLFPSASIGSPSPELNNSKDLLSDFPELAGYPYEIPNSLSVLPSHPAYDVVKLLCLCRRSKQAERDTRLQETQLGERVAAISASLLPPLKMDPIPRKNMLRELHATIEMRGEVRKIRKREKEKWKEVRTWLRLKLGEQAKDQANDGQIIEETPRCLDGVVVSVPEVENLGKKWMMNDMGQLVAKMMFRRREVSRPLANRKMATMAKDYVGSPLAMHIHTATEGSRGVVHNDDIDEIMDEMQGIIPLNPLPLDDIEMPLIIN